MKTKSIHFPTLLAITAFSCCMLFTSCNKEEDTAPDQQQNHRLKFAIASADGFAKGTTGGSGGSSVTVSNATDFKKYATSSSKYIITVSGSINIGEVSVASNKTIIGANSSAKLTGNLRISKVSNVIVQNLIITNPSGVGSGDGIEVSTSTKVFITKCTFQNCADGSSDIVRQSDNVTISWCKYEYPSQTSHNFTTLIGNGDNVTADRGKLHVTLHHNWYAAGCKERMPRVRFGQVHCYNNYYGASGSNYCVGIGNESQIKLENCYFDGQKLPWKDQRSSTSVSYTFYQAGNSFVNCSAPTWAKITSVSWPSYSYSMDAASNVKSKVTAGAGNR